MNKVMLIGNVGKDPDVRYYDADQAIAQVTFATTGRGYTLPNGTQVPDHTDWHTLVFFRALAKYVEKYVRRVTNSMLREKSGIVLSMTNRVSASIAQKSMWIIWNSYILRWRILRQHSKPQRTVILKMKILMPRHRKAGRAKMVYHFNI